jgi:N-acetylglutamate synthase-like GNAT family acetyltransferase
VGCKHSGVRPHYNFPTTRKERRWNTIATRSLADQKQKGVKKIIANAGKEENHARRFYEKNGFKQIKKATIEAPWGKKLSLVTYQLCLSLDS